MNGRIVGNFDSLEVLHPRAYFEERGIFLDCRGKLTISGKSFWGYEVAVYTASHTIINGEFGRLLLARVIVDDCAWIASRSILYNCHIGEGAIVAVGSVVRSRDVKPYTIVEGNPARPIAELINGNWVNLAGGVLDLTMLERWYL